MKTEFIRNLNSNYVRLYLEQKPEEKRYQYCILGRGGIKGLLSCSLRYIDEQAYLYYDITSTQNVAQLYEGRTITKEWMKDFLWNVQQIQQELNRFLLDDRNLIWHPSQIFQDLERKEFYFIYVPYHDGENGFPELIEYWVERADYEDDDLVEYIYKMYEQYELLGSIYLQEQIFEDAKILAKVEQKLPLPTEELQLEAREQPQIQKKSEVEEKTAKKSIRNLLEGRRKKQKEEREQLQKGVQKWVNGYAVCEEPDYQEEDYGKTVYVEEVKKEEEIIHRLYGKAGDSTITLQKSPFLIGKRKEEVDFCLSDSSISRVHARILLEEKSVFLEDLNSTNGTFKNGLRLQPYEKKKLEPEDEIKFGRKIFVYR